MSVNNQHQERLLGNIRVVDLREALDVLNRRKDELTTGYHSSPFSQDIRDALLPERFKLTTMMLYKGKTDPQVHLDHFNDLMELHQVSDLAKCHCFIVILNKGLKKGLGHWTQDQYQPSRIQLQCL